MPSDEGPSKNPFVLFKQQVDAHIGAAVHHASNLVPSLLLESVVNSRQLSAQTSATASSGHYNYDDSSPSRNADVPPEVPGWLLQQKRAAAVEQYLDDKYAAAEQLYGIEEDDTAKELFLRHRWHDFMLLSNYSPFACAMESRQPRPRDIEDDMDPNMFTFIDAFEDLLAESSGRQMPDLRTHYDRNKMLREMWTHGDNPSWFVRRLEAQELNQAFFPHSRPSQLRVTEERATRDLSDNAASYKRGAQDVHQKEELLEAEETNFFGELDRVVKALNKVLDDGLATPPFGSERRPDGNPPRETTRTREPHTENDLYDAVQSAFNEAQRSLGTFLKSFSEGKWGIETRPVSSTKSTTAPDSETYEDESSKTVKSREEFVDEYGNRHIRTEVKVTSKDGSHVSTETHYVVEPASEAGRPAIESSKNEQPGTVTEEFHGKDEERQERKKVGWFWK